MQVFMQAASKHIPTRIFQWMVENGQSPRLARARDVKIMVTSIAKELVREKADALLQGKGDQDIFSLLSVFPLRYSLPISLVYYLAVKANMDANAKLKLSEEELLAQMRWVSSVILSFFSSLKFMNTSYTARFYSQVMRLLQLLFPGCYWSLRGIPKSSPNYVMR